MKKLPGKFIRQAPFVLNKTNTKFYTTGTPSGSIIAECMQTLKMSRRERIKICIFFKYYFNIYTREKL
jgi:hypothetical protein